MNIEKIRGIQAVMKTWKISEPRGIILCVWLQKTNVPICFNIYSTNCRISQLQVINGYSFFEDAHPWNLTWQWTIPSVSSFERLGDFPAIAMYFLGAYLHPRYFDMDSIDSTGRHWNSPICHHGFATSATRKKDIEVDETWYCRENEPKNGGLKDDVPLQLGEFLYFMIIIRGVNNSAPDSLMFSTEYSKLVLYILGGSSHLASG